MNGGAGKLNNFEKLGWKKYPNQIPDERHDLLAITSDNEIERVFYTIEDSAHEHSIWHRVKYWITEEGFRKFVKLMEADGGMNEFEDLKPKKRKIPKGYWNDIFAELEEDE